MSAQADLVHVPGSRSMKRWRELLRPVGEGLREPVQAGRLRLEGASPTARVILRVALVALFGLLGSVLFGDLWRRGGLVQLNDTEGRWTFVPRVLLAVTLVALFIGWVAVLWGAARGSIPVALGGAALFVLINATIGRPSVPPITHAFGIRWGPPLARAGYIVAPSLTALYGFLGARPAWKERLRYVALGGILLSVGALFAGLLWIASATDLPGVPNSVTLLVSSDVDNVVQLLLPMLLLAAAVIVDFSYNVSRALTAPGWELRPRLLKGLLAGIIALKLWFQLGRHFSQWRTFLRINPYTVVPVLLAMAGFGLVTFLAYRLHQRPFDEEREEDVKERVIYGGVLASAMPLLFIMFLLGVVEIALTQANSAAAVRFVGDIRDFTARHVYQVRMIPWAVSLVAGAAILKLRWRSRRWRELGLGLVLLGAWNLPFYSLAALSIRFTFSEPLLNIGLTVAAAVALITLWRRINTPAAMALTVLVVFTWLAFARGEFVAKVATGVLGFLHVPVTIILVFGILFTLAADSELASGSGRHFSRDSRLLLWVGYLVVSTALLNWVLATHGSSPAETAAATGFSDVGIPLALWLLIRRPWGTPEPQIEKIEEAPR